MLRAEEEAVSMTCLNSVEGTEESQKFFSGSAVLGTDILTFETRSNVSW
jgi:hypothetical protein